MDFANLYLQRYDVLYDFWLAGTWETIPDDLMRQRPHPGVNSIAWNLWHLTRVEDGGLNRFVIDRPQVLDEGGWMEKIKIPWRHYGTGMTFSEVDDLDRRIDLAALHEYSMAVHERTREAVLQLDPDDLEGTLGQEQVRKIVLEDGLAHSQGEELVALYTGWTKGKCLLNFCLTHPYQHLGEIGVIASLLGIQF